MNQPPAPQRVSPPYLLLAGLLLGAGLLAYIAWDSTGRASPKARPGGAGIVEGTEENWEQEVLKSDLPVLVDFSAEW